MSWVLDKVSRAKNKVQDAFAEKRSDWPPQSPTRSATKGKEEEKGIARRALGAGGKAVAIGGKAVLKGGRAVGGAVAEQAGNFRRRARARSAGEVDDFDGVAPSSPGGGFQASTAMVEFRNMSGQTVTVVMDDGAAAETIGGGEAARFHPATGSSPNFEVRDVIGGVWGEANLRGVNATAGFDITDSYAVRRRW